MTPGDVIANAARQMEETGKSPAPIEGEIFRRSGGSDRRDRAERPAAMEEEEAKEEEEEEHTLCEK